MDNVLYGKLKETPSFKEFISKGISKITEDDYNQLCGRCLEETGVGYPDNWDTMGVLSKWGWSSNRQKIFNKLFKTTGCKVKWESEFEERLREYIEREGPNPGIGPLGKIEWYSQKRKELEDIMAREDNDVGC